MRFKITFNRTGRERMLPMDYQYYLSAWIYKVFGKADMEFARFLHAEGYVLGNRRFKFFNYSPLDLGKPVLWKERSLFEMSSNNLSLKVSFRLGEAAEKFIIGLFTNQEAYIGDQYNGLELMVFQVERIGEAEIHPTMNYRAKSPVVISRKNEQDKYAQYLAPTDAEYEVLLRNHLLAKYVSLPQAEGMPVDFDFQFKLISDARSKLSTIKPYSPQQSKVRGYVFDFSIKAPEEIHQLIFSCGVGEKNSMGFGWCEVVEDYGNNK